MATYRFCRSRRFAIAYKQCCAVKSLYRYTPTSLECQEAQAHFLSACCYRCFLRSEDCPSDSETVKPRSVICLLSCSAFCCFFFVGLHLRLGRRFNRHLPNQRFPIVCMLHQQHFASFALVCLSFFSLWVIVAPSLFASWLGEIPERTWRNCQANMLCLFFSISFFVSVSFL